MMFNKLSNFFSETGDPHNQFTDCEPSVPAVYNYKV